MPTLHPRRLVRDAIVAILAGATSAGSRVSKTRAVPNRTGELPAISVYTLEEHVDEASATTAPRELTRLPRVAIVAWVEDTDALPVDDAMDALALEIETAMDGDRYLTGTAGDCILSSTEMSVESSEKGDPLIGMMRMVYSVTYRTDQHDAAPTADFARAGVTVQIPGSSPDNAPNEVFMIPT